MKELGNTLLDALRSAASGGVAVAAVVAVSVTACTDFLGSSSPRPTLDAVVADEVRPINVESGPGFIRFQGHITTSIRCQQIEAKLNRYSESDGVIDLAVEARALDSCTDPRETTWNYIGNLQGIPAGNYAVTVRHRFRNQDGNDRTVFEGQLTVEPR